MLYQPLGENVRNLTIKHNAVFGVKNNKPAWGFITFQHAEIVSYTKEENITKKLELMGHFLETLTSFV